MDKLKELRANLAEKQKRLATVFDEAGPDLDMAQVKSLDGDDHAKVAWIREANSELEALHDQIKEIETIAKAKAAADAAGRYLSEPERKLFADLGIPMGEERKSLGDLFLESKAGHDLKGREVEIDIAADTLKEYLDLGAKTVMSTGAGWAPETTRTGRVVMAAVQPIEILDLIPTTTTSQSAVVYMTETTFTNNAAEVAESVEGTPGTYPESALALTEVSSPVRKIATWLPITDEQLEDEGQARSYVNNRLPFMLRQRLQTQVISGDGTAPNLSGITDRAGIQTYALAAEPVPDAIHKAITLVRVTGRAEPDAVGLHPNDWQDIRLLRTSTGIYIFGNPSDAVVPRIWGLPVAVSTVFTENTGLVGAFGEYSELAIRRGIEVKVSDSHGTFFIEGKQAIRCDMRAALQVYREAAFCTVTGI